MVGTTVGARVGNDELGASVGDWVGTWLHPLHVTRHLPPNWSSPHMASSSTARHDDNGIVSRKSGSFCACRKPQLTGEGVGLTVGVRVGLSVGVRVGLGVGLTVGCAVGCAVGRAVGRAVGLAVGRIVGLAVGVDEVGDMDGSAVGIAVGCWVQPVHVDAHRARTVRLTLEFECSHRPRLCQA